MIDTKALRESLGQDRWLTHGDDYDRARAHDMLDEIDRLRGLAEEWKRRAEGLQVLVDSREASRTKARITGINTGVAVAQERAGEEREDAERAECDRLRAEVATARALAFEEAARQCSDIGMASPANVEMALLEQSRRFRANIRALATLPASLVAVPVGTIDQVRGALERAASLCVPQEELVFRAALSALLKTDRPVTPAMASGREREMCPECRGEPAPWVCSARCSCDCHSSALLKEKRP